MNQINQIKKIFGEKNLMIIGRDDLEKRRLSQMECLELMLKSSREEKDQFQKI